jgi:hypothetical protein
VVWRPRGRFSLLITQQALLVLVGVFVIAAIIVAVVVMVIMPPRRKALTDGEALLSGAEYQNPAWRYPPMDERIDTDGIPLVQQSGALFQFV